MIGITLTTDQIRNAPAQVRQWIEHEVIASLGLAADAPATAEHPQAAHLVGCTTEDAAAVLAQIKGMMPAFTSSSLNRIISVSDRSLGMTPASLSLLALIRTITFIGISSGIWHRILQPPMITSIRKRRDRQVTGE